MQENKFEKDIQKEMGRLQLRPSDAVWERLEIELKKKKRRRVIFFIFLLAGLSILSYSGFQMSSRKTNQLTNSKSDQNTIEDENKIGGNGHADRTAIESNKYSDTK